VIHAKDVDCSKVNRKVDIRENSIVLQMHFNSYGNITKGDITYRPYMNCANQEDDVLVQLVKHEYLKKPSMKEYNLLKPVPSNSQTRDVIDLVYKGNVPRDGFFFEAGALDGESLSVTLELETKYGWSGLLVEATPVYYHQLLQKHRKAFSVNTCVALKSYPHYAWFNFESSVSGGGAMGGLAENSKTAQQMQCIPLYTLLKAAGNPRVNLFVLDIEGAEFHVLKSIPWDKVDIEVMSIETNLIGMALPGGSQESLREYVESVGYVRFAHRNDQRNDLFVRKDIVKKYNIRDYPSS